MRVPVTFPVFSTASHELLLFQVIWFYRSTYSQFLQTEIEYQHEPEDAGPVSALVQKGRGGQRGEKDLWM